MPEQVTKEILDKLANPAKGTPDGQSIRALVEAGEKTGNVDRLFGDFIRHDLGHPQIDAAFRAVLRVSAHRMLQHDVEQAKLGWSHCLTLPQSAFGLSSVTTHLFGGAHLGRLQRCHRHHQVRIGRALPCRRATRDVRA